MTLPDGSNYESKWKDSKKHGQGVFTLSFMGTELKYVGEFRNDRSWNIITYDENGGIVVKTVNGAKQSSSFKKKPIQLRVGSHFCIYLQN